MTGAVAPVVVRAATQEAVEQDVAASGSVVFDAWSTVVWNDPVNLMSYVAYVFESYFGYSAERANALMLRVHEEGRAVVSHGGRERMEVDVQAMHDYGLWATLHREAA